MLNLRKIFCSLSSDRRVVSGSGGMTAAEEGIHAALRNSTAVPSWEDVLPPVSIVLAPCDAASNWWKGEGELGSMNARACVREG